VSDLPRLLPLERRFALLVFMRQQSHRTPAVARLERIWGRDRIAYSSAALLWANLGALVGLSGMGALLASGDRGAALAVGYVLLLSGIILELPAIFRAAQAVHAGRRLRPGTTPRG
jgi:hypothetical protein